MTHELHVSSGASAFTPAECEALRAADRDAAAHIVGLMVGIFLVGLVGYLAIAIWAA